jgi:hypothetical protein
LELLKFFTQSPNEKLKPRADAVRVVGELMRQISFKCGDAARYDNAVLEQKGTKLRDQCGALVHHPVSNAVHCLEVELLDCLHAIHIMPTYSPVKRSRSATGTTRITERSSQSGRGT